MLVWRWLVAIWCVVSLLVAALGYFSLQGLWRAEVQRQLMRDALAAKTIFEAGKWQQPVEDDEQWKAAQQELAIAAFPTVAGSTETANLEDRRVHWQRIADRGYRVAVDLALDGSKGLRVVREAGKPDFGVWFWGWAALNGCALIATVVSFFRLRNLPKSVQAAFEPWSEALEDIGKETERLLPVQSSDDRELGIQLEAAAASINQAYADLKASSDRSNLVLGNLRDGVLAVDGDLRILLANRALLKLLEIEREDYQYRPYLEIIRTPTINNLIAQALESNVPAQDEFQFGKSARDLRAFARQLRLADGTTGVLITIRDETLIKRVDMIKRDFVNNASHELKTPLAAIRAYAETLQGGVADKERSRYFVGNIVSQADRLNGLVQGMLQLSRVEEGASLKFVDFDVGEAIEPCVLSSLGVAESKGVDLQVDAPEEPLVICSDRDGFQTIASNLLSNAVRYTEAGGRVSVRLSIMEEQLVFEVSDTGIGMSEQDLERIFERFYRAQKDRNTSSGGTGLGLSIVKHLVQGLGGTVSASSQIDEGSSFVVKLPLRPGN